MSPRSWPEGGPRLAGEHENAVLAGICKVYYIFGGITQFPPPSPHENGKGTQLRGSTKEPVARWHFLGFGGTLI